MNPHVQLVEHGRTGPRVLLLPGLGARGSGFAALARILAEHCRPVLVEYPTGTFAGVGTAALADQVARAAGPVDGVVASSLAGLVAAHLAGAGRVRGIAFVGSFAHREHLGVRGRLVWALGPIATWARPGRLAAMVAAHAAVTPDDAPHVVPMSRIERESTWLRAFAAHREPPPPPLRDLPIACVAVHGRRDWLVPVGTLRRLVGALPPGTPAHVIEDAGHVPYFTHPGELARLLAPWVDRLDVAEVRARAS